MTQEQHDMNELKLQNALRLIKIHITSDYTRLNWDLHEAIQLIVDVARQHEYLEK